MTKIGFVLAQKTLLKNVEQIEIIEEAEDLKCPECGADMKKIGKEYVRQELKYLLQMDMLATTILKM